MNNHTELDPQLDALFKNLNSELDAIALPDVEDTLQEVFALDELEPPVWPVMVAMVLVLCSAAGAVWTLAQLTDTLAMIMA